ncbi:heterokaryon incompatibility protein-domain-containing protein [Earliella scabrosa]|nr:heterokaryon incompatibility protein-domain-containing protein [Earliella scabrosa]
MPDGDQDHHSSPAPLIDGTIEAPAASRTLSPSELVEEQVLCPQCQYAVVNCPPLQSDQYPTRGSSMSKFRHYFDFQSLEASAAVYPASSALPCHLCSLILGRIRLAEQQQRVVIPSRPVNVAFTVSRSGGVTLDIDIGEISNRREIGELVLLPADEADISSLSPPAEARFTFSSRDSAHIPRNAQIAKSLSSEATFSLAREWLAQCLENHPRCTQAARLAVGRPLRLVDVGDNHGTDPKIVIMDPSEPSPVYLTLSHCWGGATILRLLLENVDTLTKGIPMGDLPKTFRDAVIITRRLGYRYIWIDSLCIIQDSPSDWRTNAAVMGEIYAGSACTVAALTARNAHDGGCFFDHARNPLFFCSCRLSPHWTVDGNTPVGTDLRLPPPSLGPLPLHTRAWVVQERLLAPRTLYYGSTGLAWECVECSATESVPGGEVSRFSPKASFFEIMHQLPADRADQAEFEEKVYDLWTDVQIAYSRCLLTRFEDRLVAISGVIKRIEAAVGWRSMWGIWRERVLVDLLWFVEEPSVRPATPEYLAPSWSWAGLAGRVTMAVGRGGRGCQWTAEVVDDGTLQDGRGYLQIRAMAKSVTLTPQGKLNPGVGRLAPSWEEVDWEPDESLAADDAGRELRCISIARIPDYLGPDTPAFEIGIVVRDVDGGGGGQWARMGLFRQLRDGDLSLFPEELDDVAPLTLV